MKNIYIYDLLWSGGVIFGHMITEFFLSELNIMNLEYMWFQQDSTTPHFSNKTIGHPEQVIGQSSGHLLSCKRKSLVRYYFGHLNFRGLVSLGIFHI